MFVSTFNFSHRAIQLATSMTQGRVIHTDRSSPRGNTLKYMVPYWHKPVQWYNIGHNVYGTCIFPLIIIGATILYHTMYL